MVTLTETVFVIGIGVGLMAYTLPQLAKSKEATRDTKCKMQLKQWGVGLSDLIAQGRNATYPSFSTYDSFYSRINMPQIQGCPSDRKEEGPLARFGFSYGCILVGTSSVNFERYSELMGDFEQWHFGKSNYLKSDGSIRGLGN